MGNKMIGEVWESDIPRDLSFIVLLRIADWCNDEGETEAIEMERLAKLCGIDYDACLRAVDSLVNRGYLSYWDSVRENCKHWHMYRVTPPMRGGK